MAGQVDTATRKRRAAEALALAAQARARFALSLVGGEMRVLFETQLADGRWLGHAESHVLVAADSPDGGPLHKVLAVVRAESVDPEAPDRIRGRLIAVEPPLVPPTLPPVAVDSPISRQTLAESADT